MGPVKRWWSVLLPKLSKFLRKRGGNVLMAQIENEYGNFGCDLDYLKSLRDEVWRHWGRDVVLYATDNAVSGALRCSKIPGVYATVDFGPNADPRAAFASQRAFEPHGPLVNSELYAAWLDVWGKPHNTLPAEAFSEALNDNLALGANVNVYMAHGGTSFAFESGAGRSNGYSPDVTSYDYDAPVAESGDLGEKFFAVRDVLKRYVSVPELTANASVEKMHLGPFEMHFVLSLEEAVLLEAENVGAFTPIKVKFPQTFEWLGQDSGFVLYQTRIEDAFSDPCVLSTNGLGDRAYILVEGKLQGILTRTGGVERATISIRKGKRTTFSLV